MQDDLKYTLLDYYEYIAKNKKEYLIACVYCSGSNTHELMKICLSKTDDIIDFLHDNLNEDITDNVKFKFNSYKKAYEPYIAL